MRECERTDRLVTELVKMTSDMMEAKETAAKLEGELAARRSIPEQEPLRWWRREPGDHPMNALMSTRVAIARRGLPLLPSLTYLLATSPLGLRFRRAAANDNRPTASGHGRLTLLWPVLAVLVLPLLITTIGVVIALM